MTPPGPDTLYQVPRTVLEDTWRLLAAPGTKGFEASTLWVASPAVASPAVVGAAWRVDRVVRPQQTAWRGDHGLCVSLTDHALLDVIQTLRRGEAVAARQHTHPARAYHSNVDDLNLAIGHVGAISIVVPNFAAGTPDLAACSVNQLGHGGWRELSAHEVSERFQIT